MGGSGQNDLPVLLGQVRREERDCGQVKAAVPEEREEGRMLARGAGCDDAQIRLGLGEMEALRTVDEHRGAGLARVEPSLVDLGDVRDDVGLGAA